VSGTGPGSCSSGAPYHIQRLSHSCAWFQLTKIRVISSYTCDRSIPHHGAPTPCSNPSRTRVTRYASAEWLVICADEHFAGSSVARRRCFRRLAATAARPLPSSDIVPSEASTRRECSGEVPESRSLRGHVEPQARMPSISASRPATIRTSEHRL